MNEVEFKYAKTFLKLQHNNVKISTNTKLSRFTVFGPFVSV